MSKNAKYAMSAKLKCHNLRINLVIFFILFENYAEIDDLRNILYVHEKIKLKI